MGTGVVGAGYRYRVVGTGGTGDRVLNYGTRYWTTGPVTVLLRPVIDPLGPVIDHWDQYRPVLTHWDQY